VGLCLFVLCRRKKKKKKVEEVVETIERVEEKKSNRTAAQKAFEKVQEQRVSFTDSIP